MVAKRLKPNFLMNNSERTLRSINMTKYQLMYDNDNTTVTNWHLLDLDEGFCLFLNTPLFDKYG